MTFSSVGLGALTFGLWQLWQEISPRRWMRVPGTVVSSVTERQANGRGGYQYVTKVEYEYSYNDQTFRSSRRRASNYAFGWKTEAEAISLRYPLGGALTVLVDPGKPTRAALEYGVTPLSAICIVLGVGTLVMGLVIPFM